MKIRMIEYVEDKYRSLSAGLFMEREYDSITPNGNKMNGRWVLRNERNEMLDFDQYRNDLAERHNLEYVSDNP